MANPWDSDPVVDAGGNPWDSDPIISAPSKKAAPRRAGPDFSNVSSRVTTTETGRKRKTPEQARALAVAAQQSIDARTGSNGASPLQTFLAGLGKSGIDTAQGLQQFGVDATGAVMRGQGNLYSAVGGDRAAAQANRLAGTIEGYGNQIRSDVTQRRQDEAGLMDSPYGVAGNITGTLAQLLGPGVLARGTAAGSALLPMTVRGNAAQGAVIGAIQPVAAGDSRAVNAAIGATGGAVGAKASQSIGGMARILRERGLSGAEARAGRTLLDEATDPAFMQRIQQSAVPGVNRTLGEATLDPGIMALENVQRGERRGMFDGIDSVNNLQRIRQLENIAGTEADMAAAIAAREAAAGPLYAQAAGINVTPSPELTAVLGRLPSGVMSKARQLARMEGAPFDDKQMTGQSLHYVKLALDDALGRSGPGSLGNTEKRIVMGVKENLLGEMSQALPTYGQALGQFGTLSQPINRMQVGRELIERGAKGVPDTTGVARLTPDAFNKASRDLDYTAQQATGFPKAQADKILTPADLQSIRSIRDDLERQFARTREAAANSATQGRMAVAGRIASKEAGRVLARAIPGVGPAADYFEQQANQALQQKLAFLIANPKEAERVLSVLSKKDQSALRFALMQLTARGGASTSALSE